MKAAAYTQGQGLSFADAPVPSVEDGELLVRVMASSICGTDVRIIRNGQRKLRDGERVILGHEFAGVVERGAGRFREGDRVGIAPNIGCGQCAMCVRGLPNMCPDYTAFGINIDGAHAEYVRVPREALAQGSVTFLPETVSFEAASLVEPLSCAVSGNRAAQIAMGDTVLIVGAGPIGLLHIALARLSGAANVIIADVQPERLEQARAFGPDLIVNSAQEDLREIAMRETGGWGLDAVITACSVPEVQAQALELLAPYGRVCFFGGLPKDRSKVLLDTNLIHYKNLVVTGMTGGAPRDYRLAMSLVASGRIDVTCVISHTFAQDAMAEAFDTALNRPAMKVVIRRGA